MPRLTDKQALSYTWLTSIGSPTEHDLCGMRVNFEPHPRWRPAIGAARACHGSRKAMAQAITPETC
jgi:hypothetical protein